MMRITGNPRLSISTDSKLAELGSLPTEAIFVSNHVSQLDINAASWAIPHPIVFLAKSSIRKVPILGTLNERVGTVFINRSDQSKSREAVFQLETTLKKGISVLVFPEGTRSMNERIQPFKKGAFYLAAHAQIPIVPLHIYGTQKVLPKGSFLIQSNPIHVRFGTPIYPAGNTPKDIQELTITSEKAVRALSLWHKQQISTPQ